MAPVDRKKYAVDVLEHVLGGVRAISADAVEPNRSEVVRLGLRPWLGLGTTDAEPTGSREPRPPVPARRRRGRPDVYEGDRRGEHVYRQDARTGEEPSHRQRRELKQRLERER